MKVQCRKQARLPAAAAGRLANRATDAHGRQPPTLRLNPYKVFDDAPMHSNTHIFISMRQYAN